MLIVETLGPLQGKHEADVGSALKSDLFWTVIR